MRRLLIPAIILGILVFLPVAVILARPMTVAYRECMQEAYRRYYEETLASARTAHDEFAQAAELRRQQYIDSWDTEDDADQRKLQRDADRTYNLRAVEIRREQNRRDRDLNRAFSDDRRTCRDLNRPPRLSPPPPSPPPPPTSGRPPCALVYCPADIPCPCEPAR